MIHSFTALAVALEHPSRSMRLWPMQARQKALLVVSKQRVCPLSHLQCPSQSNDVCRLHSMSKRQRQRFQRMLFLSGSAKSLSGSSAGVQMKSSNWQIAIIIIHRLTALHLIPIILGKSSVKKPCAKDMLRSGRSPLPSLNSWNQYPTVK